MEIPKEKNKESISEILKHMKQETNLYKIEKTKMTFSIPLNSFNKMKKITELTTIIKIILILSLILSALITLNISQLILFFIAFLGIISSYKAISTIRYKRKDIDLDLFFSYMKQHAMYQFIFWIGLFISVIIKIIIMILL